MECSCIFDDDGELLVFDPKCPAERAERLKVVLPMVVGGGLFFSGVACGFGLAMRVAKRY